jgi:hypothetical protein
LLRIAHGRTAGSIAAVGQAPRDHLGLDFGRALEDREDSRIAQDARDLDIPTQSRLPQWICDRLLHRRLGDAHRTRPRRRPHLDLESRPARRIEHVLEIAQAGARRVDQHRPDALRRRQHGVAAIAVFIVAVVLIAMDDHLVADFPAPHLGADRPDDAGGVGPATW